MKKRGQSMAIIIFLIVIIFVSIIVLISTLFSVNIFSLFGGSEDGNSENNTQGNSIAVGGALPTNVSVNNPVENQTNTSETADLYIDLEASGIKLNTTSCAEWSNSTNSSCTVHITGTIRNIGTAPVTENFVVHFLDVNQSETDLIDLVVISEDIAPGVEKNVTAQYENVPYGKYFIRYVIDATYYVSELNENNNFKTGIIEVHNL